MPKKDPKEVLTAMERGVFDALMALSAAMDKGILVGFLTFPSANGCGIELIFPPKPDANDDEPNPSRKLEAATPIAALSMAGKIMHQHLVLEHQNTMNHGDYIEKVQEHRRLRTSKIIVTKSTGMN